MSENGQYSEGSEGIDAGRSDPAGGDSGGHAAKRQRPGTGREEQVRPHHPQGSGRLRDAQRPELLLPDEGAMVDEHGRPPGVPSRTGTGSSSPPSDPERVERAAAGETGPGASRR
ncbi:hypothetical protein [Streptomyces sp. AP-93]|uniref:hypothetical protein n=1 Tax=Streptomyces sp. AP-93 TaxID=2929048 RepID=UPI001FAEAFD4|nr:hypothetical protein [Streptomyces sp. AP-93]MCJ0869744.1 hypothetical protein [Streptomyces sp. AP-93]